MKTFKDIINEVAEPKGGDEKRFKAKHVVAKYDHPAAEDEQFTAKDVKKDKTKKASYKDDKDEEVYEGYVSDAQRKAVHASKDEQKKKKTYKEMFSLEESNTDKYMWKDINDALMKAGVNTSTIMKVISNLKGKQLKENYMMSEDPWEEVPMMARQMEFVCEAAEDIKEYVMSGIDPEEWFQNKVAHVHGQMQGLYAYVEGDERMKSAKMADMNPMGEEVELEERVYASDYNVGSEKSQFGGYRPHVTHKKTGKTMYLGQTSYKKPEHAKGHADAYLKGYEQMGDRHANRKASEYEKSNKQHLYQKEEVELDEAFKMGSMKLKDGSTVKLSKEEAEAVNELFSELNSSNKKRMEEEMMKDKSGFDKVLKFAKEAM